MALTVNSLGVSLNFGKYNGLNIIEAIEQSPIYNTGGLKDVNGVIQWKGFRISNKGNFISYLEWAQEKDILLVTPKAWKEIKEYDKLFCITEGYKNEDKLVEEKIFLQSKKELKKIRDKYNY